MFARHASTARGDRGGVPPPAPRLRAPTTSRGISRSFPRRAQAPYPPRRGKGGAAFYAGKAGQEWLEALAPLGTDDDKAYLDVAPWHIIVFGQRRGGIEPGDDKNNYYVTESVGIACGFLLAALHSAGPCDPDPHALADGLPARTVRPPATKSR